MNKDINWDNYYNGYSPFEKEEIPQDCILYVDDIPDDLDFFDDTNYLGPKTNATVTQIKSYFRLNQHDNKFLLNNNTVVVLLDYSKKIIDKWKNGRVLYCYGEGLYTEAENISKLSLVDKMLFHSGSSGEVRIYAFWKDENKNYNFVNGILVLSEDPYQIEDGNGFRWVFPLALTSKIPFRMPEKYSCNFDVRKVKRKTLEEDQKQDEIQLLNFNSDEEFDIFSHKPVYKGVPQKKVLLAHKGESLVRNPQVSANALKIANFKCEINTGHPTFIRKKQDVPYTEAHHLVPLAYSELFQYSLDIEENVVSLCSNCHNEIHYGKNAAILIKKLFDDRKELLKQAGICLSERELLSMYGVENMDI